MEGPFTTILSMNRLSIADRAKILGMLVEGNSLRSCARMADVSLNTVTKLLVDLGAACEQFHDERVNNVRVRRLQCDEIWCFVGAKAKNVTLEQKAQGWGDTWTWTGLDADTKLCVSYLVGGRSADWAMEFMLDCAARIKGRVQVTTDGHKAYLEAVETAFGADCDYAQLQKIYGAPAENDTRYSPAVCIGCDMKVVSGDPDPEACEHVLRGAPQPEHANGHETLHPTDECFQQENPESRGNGCNLRRTLQFRQNPQDAENHSGMAAGLSDHVWSLEEIVLMADSYMPKAGKRGPYKKATA